MNIDGNFPSYERQTTILQNTEEIKSTLPAIGKKKRTQTFVTNGTWLAPPGVTRVFLTGGGGGGGGASGGGSGGAGGITSFSNLYSMIGGGGGSTGYGYGGPSGGPAGQRGSNHGNSYGFDLSGGDSGPYFGGKAASPVAGGYVSNGTNGGYCSGGGGGGTSNTMIYASGGGARFDYNREVEVTPGVSYPITIGTGGAGGPSGGAGNGIGGDGGNGILTIEWWE